MGNQRVSRKTVKVPTEQFARFVSRILSPTTVCGTRQSWRKKVTSILSLWHGGEISHSVATQSLDELLLVARERNYGWDPLIAVSQLALAVGLYTSSQRFLGDAWNVMDRSARSAQTVDFRLARLKQLLYQGKLDQASHELGEIRSMNLPPRVDKSIERIGWYLSICLGGGPEGPKLIIQDSVGRSWQDNVQDRDVLIVGPGKTDRLPTVGPGFLVARVVGPGVWEWTDPGDVASNVTDAVYSIPENIENERNSGNSAFFAKLDTYRFVNVKKTDVLGSRNSRRVDTFSSLFSFGHPQMVPLAILDILSHSGRPVVVGTDFFQSPAAYRDSDRRKPGRKVQDQSGSDGGSFDRSALMASHNIFENWSIVKNLIDAGLVRGDHGFARSLSCSVEELFSRYDDVIGKHRI